MSAPVRWIGTAGCLVDISSLLANCCGGSAVTLMGRHEFDGAVPVSVVVPVHKHRQPFTGLVLGGKGPAEVVGPGLDRSEQGFRVRVSLETLGLEKDLSTPISSSRDSSVAPRNSARSLRLGIAVVGVEDQGRLLALATAKATGAVVALLEAGSLDKIRCDLGRFDLGHIPGHHFAAPDGDHQIEVEPHTTHRGRQEADVP